MSAVLADAPTTRIYPSDKPRDQRSIAVEDRPERESAGLRFLAYFHGSPNGICGFGRCESSAIDDLWDMVADWEEQLRERDEA